MPQVDTEMEAPRLDGAIGRESNLPVDRRDAVQAHAGARVALSVDVHEVEACLGVEVDHPERRRRHG